MPTTPAAAQPCPLCVDLDGTLIRTDLLWESLRCLLKAKPWYLFLLPLWLYRGRAYLKRRIAEKCDLDVSILPYRQPVIDYINQCKSAGRLVILATASDIQLADKIQQHLHLFDDVIASDGCINLKGAHKAALLQRRFGSKGYDYAGDSRSDLPVWAAAHAAIVVSDKPSLVARVQKITHVAKTLPGNTLNARVIYKTLRVHQWTKNLLLFIPILASHNLQNPHFLMRGLFAFLAFSLTASGVYIANDLFDLESDRQHRTKRERPFAAGTLSLPVGLALAVGIPCLGLLIGWTCGRDFLLLLAGYYVLSFIYSGYIKQVVVLDVIVLACFYVFRIIAGGMATSIGCSVWLLTFAMFFFFSLAMVKRHSELKEKLLSSGGRIAGRGYMPSDIDLIAMFGVGSALCSILVLVLYVKSSEVALLYHTPALLLFLGPLLLYWITRVWILAHRGEMPQDPVSFAIRDRASYLVGMLAGVILYFATRPS